MATTYKGDETQRSKALQGVPHWNISKFLIWKRWFERSFVVRLKIKGSETAWSKDNCYLGAVCLNFFWVTDHEFGMEHACLKCLKRKQVLVAK